MIDGRHYRVDETLRDGTQITIRAVRSDDKERVVDAFLQLDSQSIYTRFFGYRKEPTEAELARIDALDFVREVGLVATIGTDNEIVIGGARYVARVEAGVRVAEVAFTVEEDYRGRGIAGRLLEHLITIARELGIVRFEAEVLADNKPMRAVFDRTGMPIKQSRRSGIVFTRLLLLREPPAVDWQTRPTNLRCGLGAQEHR